MTMCPGIQEIMTQQPQNPREKKVHPYKTACEYTVCVQVTVKHIQTEQCNTANAYQVFSLVDRLTYTVHKYFEIISR